MWDISEQDLGSISTGAAILGAGGGGNPYIGHLRVRETLRSGKRIRVIPPGDLADDDLVAVCGGMGSPVVAYEKLAQGNEEFAALREIEKILGRRVDAVAPFEMGGGNSMAPMVVAATAGVPLVDGDGMGRAFPELQMTTYMIYGAPQCPSAIADERGNRLVFTAVAESRWLERMARAVTVSMGGHAGVATTPMSGAFCRRVIIPGTLTLARDIGMAVEEAIRSKSEACDAVLAVTKGCRYLRGKVVDVERQNTKGFARGSLTLEGTGSDSGRRVRIDFQNENLVLWEDDDARATVPDLITLITTDRGEPLTTELVTYGCRADVLVLPCADLLRTEQALSVVGPRCFGFDLDPVLLGAPWGFGVTERVEHHAAPRHSSVDGESGVT
ncbi:MAG TPA: DUF917 domain-containing protein [Streptosporangiaceae bacterium]|nr:DUF917 domain-containing protein [Streptosporangiaceae bacterium]